MYVLRRPLVILGLRETLVQWPELKRIEVRMKRTAEGVARRRANDSCEVQSV